jgi:hypothetical protein
LSKLAIALLVVFSFSISNTVFAEGTPQMSPTNSANDTVLISAPDIGFGPYRNAPNENPDKIKIRVEYFS